MGIVCSKKPAPSHTRHRNSFGKSRRRSLSQASPSPGGGSSGPTAAPPTLLSLCVDVLCDSLGQQRPERLRALPPDCCQLLLERLLERGRLDTAALRALAGAHFHALALDGCPSPSPLPPSWLRGLCSASLESAALVCAGVGDAALLQVGPLLPRLHTLRLECCPNLTDAGLAVLGGMPALRELSLAGCEALTEAALPFIALVTSLATLNLQTCHRLYGLHQLRPLQRLRHLDCGWCGRVSDRDAAALSALPGLTFLSLSGCSVGDAGLAPLAALQELEVVGLGTLPAATDAGLAALLGALPRLRVVHLERSGQAGERTLRALCGGGGGGGSGPPTSAPSSASSPPSSSPQQERRPLLEELHLGYTGVADGCLSVLAAPGLRVLSLESCRVSDRGLGLLSALAELETLDLSDTGAGDEAMAAVGRLRKLRSLDLGFTQVTDAGLRRLAGLPLLRLSLDSRLFTDAGMEHVARLADLEVLDLFGARVTDAACTHLCKLRKLRSLEICGGGITDAGVARLSCGTFPLERLSLALNPRISNASIPSLLRLTSLRELNLSQSRVTGSAVVALGCLPSLEALALSGTKVRTGAADKLQSINPNLEITGVS